MDKVPPDGKPMTPPVWISGNRHAFCHIGTESWKGKTQPQNDILDGCFDHSGRFLRGVKCLYTADICFVPSAV